MNLEKELERGQRAERILRDEAFNEAWDTVRGAILAQWEACPIRDKEGAHELKLMLKLLGDVRAVFSRAIEDGKLAAIELERLNSRAPIKPADMRYR